jgi:hypothetical protein
VPFGHRPERSKDSTSMSILNCSAIRKGTRQTFEIVWSVRTNCVSLLVMIFVHGQIDWNMCFITEKDNASTEVFRYAVAGYVPLLAIIAAAMKESFWTLTPRDFESTM